MFTRIFVLEDLINIQQELQDWLDAEQPTIWDYELDAVNGKSVMFVTYTILPKEPPYRTWPGGISVSVLTAS